MERFNLFRKTPNMEKRTPIKSASVWKCKMCKTAQANYTCPRCNLPYCSIACYKSQSHADCSESFYKDCVMENLQGRGVSKQTRKKMMDLLKKVQQETEDEPDVLENIGQNRDHTLSLDQRLHGVDLDEDLDNIWDLLTDEEKREFEEFTRGGNLSEVIEVWEPWWMQEIVHPKIVELDGTDGSLDLYDRPDIPPVVDYPDLTDLFRRHPPSPSVAFACINTLYAYVLVCRAYNGDHLLLAEEAGEHLLEASRGLRGDRVLHSFEEAVLTVMSDIDNSGLRVLLESRDRRAEGLKDLLRILIEPVFIQGALCDAHALLKKCWKLATNKRKCAAAFKKLEYFLAYVDRYSEEVEKAGPTIRFQHAAYVGETLEQLNAARTIGEQNPKSDVAKKKSQLIEEIPGGF